MADENPTTVTEDEIQAAIAEIENMSAIEAAAIPSSDGSEDVSGSRERRSPTEPDPANAGAGGERAVTAQPGAQPDRAAGGRADSQDEPADAASGVAQRVRACVRRVRAGLSWAPARLGLLWGRKSADTPLQEVPQQPATEAPGASIDDTLPAEGFCRLVDQALDKLNQPFARFSGGVRRAIGLAAVVTVVISLAALLLFPYVLPQRDAVSFLREKRAQLDVQPPAAAPPESPTAGNDSPRP